jgi:cysteine desulfurase
MINRKNYFDYAAATPLCDEAVEAMKPYYQDKYYNPSAIYLAAAENKKSLESYRQVIASGIGAKPAEIIFTAGGTEANNLAIQGVMNDHPGKNIIISAIEHESVIEPANLFICKTAAVNKQGFVDIEKLTKLIDDNTLLISIMYANNEIGTIQPLKKISGVIKKVTKERLSKNIITPLYLHCDACQACNYLDMQTSRLGVDLMTINSGKIYGPKQCGALYKKTSVNIKPIILGGGQEKNLRSGTENLANIAGFAAAWQEIRKTQKDEALRLSSLRDKFINQLQVKLPNATINGPVKNLRLPNNISVALTGFDNETLAMMLDESGFMVATGSACKAASSKPSAVLRAIGQPQGSIRITMGRQTTKKSLDDLLKALIKLTTT